MNWLLTSFQWYFYLLLIGVVFYPLTKRIFAKFSFDFAYPFAKVLAIILFSYTAYVLGTIKILPFNRMSLFLMIGISVLINFFIFRCHSEPFDFAQGRLRRGILKKISPLAALGRNDRWVIFFFEELLFLSSLLFWTFIRSQESSIRSLEKFMDFGFMNSILRSNYFPPKDIWYPPLPINYYYFGHLTGAFLIKLSNVKPAIGYNLILSTIFALGITQVFSFVVNIIKLYQVKIKTVSAVIFGLIGAFLINLGGNLHTIYAFTTGYSTADNAIPTPFWKILSGFNPASYWYPNATRFIPFTIHEFPSYSYVVADLHGHVFDIPFVLLTLAILFLFFTSFRHPEGVKRPKDLAKRNYFNFTLPEPALSVVEGVARFLASLGMTKNEAGMTWGGVVFLGFLTAVHYMTNAFDGPIYILLSTIVFYFIFRLSWKFFTSFLILTSSFKIFSLPFSSHFTPFIS